MRGKPYLDSMVRDVAIFLRSFSRALFAALLILCIAVSPVCAARCASALCASSLSGQPAESCHQSSSRMATGHVPVLSSVPASTPCAAADLLFTSPRLEDFAISIESQFAAHVFLPVPSNPGSTLSAANFDDSFLPPALSHPPGSFAPLPLRI